VLALHGDAVHFNAKNGNAHCSVHKAGVKVPHGSSNILLCTNLLQLRPCTVSVCNEHTSKLTRTHTHTRTATFTDKCVTSLCPFSHPIYAFPKILFVHPSPPLL
jgi:hypothetical protein